MHKAVIFDVDGTLMDTVPMHAKAWAEAFGHFGFQVQEEDVRQQIGKGGDQLMPVFLDQDTIERLGEEIEEFRGALFREKYFPTARPFPMVRELFQRLHDDGTLVALGSSGKSDEVESYMELAGITELVDAKTTSEDADRSKPHPDIFQAALGKLGDIPPAFALVVGDSPFDAEAAGKAGMRTLGLLSGGFTEQQLRAAGCIEIFRDPEDLLQRFDASRLGPGAG